MFGRRAIGCYPCLYMVTAYHKEVEYCEEGSGKKVESWEKIWGYVAEEGEFENRGQEPPGPRKRPQKIFEKIMKKV